MTFPMNVTIGDFSMNAHFLVEILAYSLGFQYYLALKKKSKETLTFDDRIWIIVGAAAGALLGSRVIGYFSAATVHFKNITELWLLIFSSKSILGGLLGGVVGVELTKKMMKITQTTGDLFVYPLILAMMIGRVGCLSQGVFDGTHGIPSDLPWALDMGDGIRRHPTQLYEIVFLGGLWMVLKQWEPNLCEGARFKLFMVAYLFYRLFSEWLKPAVFYPFGLSAVQVACLLGLLYYAKVLIYFRRLWKT